MGYHAIMSTETKGPDVKVGIDELRGLLKEMELDRVHHEFINRLSTIVLAALGLVTALAWDDVLRQIFADFLGAGSTLIQKIYYAVTVTFLAALISVALAKIAFRITRGAKQKK